MAGTSVSIYNTFECQRNLRQTLNLVDDERQSGLPCEDFLSAFDGDRSDIASITPSQLAELQPGDSLLIVVRQHDVHATCVSKPFNLA